MSYLNSESNQFFYEEVSIENKNKTDLILKMDLVELILHAIILIILV